MHFNGINLVMTVIGFAVSTMFIVFVCSRLVCARIQLNATRRSFSTASRSDLSTLERGIHGMEPLVIATFPTKKFSDDFFSSGDDSQCTVCLGEYQKKDILRILPYCRHYFHVTCIDTWLQQNATCPVCRISLRDSPGSNKCIVQPVFSSAVGPYGTDSLERAADSLRMEPIQEDQSTSELDAAEAGESSFSTDSSQFRKDGGRNELESSSSRVHPIQSNS